MPIIDPRQSLLLVIDVQTRLMPAIHEADMVVRNAGRLLAAAGMLGVRCVFTEQNAKGLGSTVVDLPIGDGTLIHKQSFDAGRAEGFTEALGAARQIVVTGCEAHVCVLQSVLGLLSSSRQVHVVQDAIGSRSPLDKEAAIRRMAQHGADIVTTEMVVFEWLETAEHPRFREAVRLIK